MSEDSLLLDTADGIARVTLNRPAVHNAFDDALIARMRETFGRLAEDRAVRAVVIAGNGKSFSAGADLNWMRKTADYSEAENRADARVLAEALHVLATMPKPTLALVHGGTYGGGLGLIAAADIAIATDDAVFSLSEVKLGLIPAVVSPYVVAAVGARAARRYFLTGERFDAAEAQRIGLVHEVVPAASLQSAGERMIDALLQCGPVAQGEAKALIAAVEGRPVDEAVREDTARRIAERRAAPEGREGVAAFLEKRRPAWRAERSG